MESGYTSNRGPDRFQDFDPYPSSRDDTLGRGRTLSRPERHLPVAPLLSGKKEKDDSWDSWVIFSRVVTFWAPGVLLSSLGGLNDAQSQQAWREKVALCFIAVIMGGIVAFLTVGFASVLCPPSQENNPNQFLRFNESPEGWQFNVVNAKSTPTLNFSKLMIEQNGQDITNLFKRNDPSQCSSKQVKQYTIVRDSVCSPDNCANRTFDISDATFKQLNIFNTSRKVGFDWDQLNDPFLKNYLVVDGFLLNLNPYILANPPNKSDILDTVIRTVLAGTHGKDATRLLFGRDDMRAAVNCLIAKYYAGNIDKKTIGCFTSQLFLYFSLTVILGIVLTRFIMACVFNWFISHRLALPPKNTNRVAPMPISQYGNQGSIGHANGHVKTLNDVGNDLFTVLLVTCYSEGELGIRGTCESMASTEYPDERKLLFLICDGIITGSGEEKSTPDICVGLMELDPAFKDPQPQSYIAVAAGSKQHNMAKVYAGYFVWNGRRVPMITVVKCGTPAEAGKAKPGNRGKRDSQLILMSFFSHVTYNDRMCPLDYDLFRKVHHLMGVTPDFFEIVLMVDADTKVYPDSLRLLINCMCNDNLIMGLCGETKIANKRTSFTSAIQVFEYYISHHLGKGFESVFGGVTCLPGCFCMYRLKARKGDSDWVPIITKPEIVQEYSQNIVDTLHQKNLLLLGEDRFLTTLMLRNFPHRKMMFCPQAVCKTIVPDEFKVLLSQRRRWINSTIHNLMELVLVRNLCGTFCFSMQFVIFMELIGTVVLPVAILLTYSLIVNSILNPPKEFADLIPLLMLVMVLGLPAVMILLTTRKLVYIAWMVVYLLALPIWNFILPTYAYWHFDDFSWGETRKVDGETKGDDHGKKEGQFDSSKVPLKRWEDWERTRLRRERRSKERQQSTKYNNKALTADDNTRLLRSGHDDVYYSETASNHSASSTQEVEQPTQFYNYNLTQQSNPAQYGYYQQEQYNYNIRNDRGPHSDQYNPAYRQNQGQY
ncbi:27255_t:CDS:2 [Dentiscutata erythropus]|uniref:chitin synthase n=1 Tax=Dentiscutata erythropus TaxID=1348616 RepID=A0A9N9A4M5_9GLOM|nr:27255_t:CDS:2 [Dentiscutata erythropus]